jgi:phosphoribosylformylglycinamidine cyclo-ligase
MTGHAPTGTPTDTSEQAAKLLYRAARASWGRRRLRLGEVLTPYDDYSGVRAIDAGQLPPGTFMGLTSGAIGAKATLAARAGRYDSLAFDLLAAVCDEAVTRGGEPVVVSSLLALPPGDSLGAVKQLAEAATAAAAAAGVAIINADLTPAPALGHPNSEPHPSLSWSATATWFANEHRLITGDQIRPGDSIIGLAEPGLRLGGVALLDRALETKYGPDWPVQALDGTPLIDLALAPSAIYTPAILDMFGGWSLEQPARARLHALANLTADGLPGRLARALKSSGYGANIDNPLPPPRLLLHAQEAGQITDREAYQSWPMGQGMVIVTPEPHAALAIARGHHLDAQVIGNVTDAPAIRIASAGFYSGQEPWLEF